MVASSEQHNAPVIVIKPAIAQASSSHPGAPLKRDDSAETMKMPDPIIEPITIMVASIGPSARTSNEAEAARSPRALDCRSIPAFIHRVRVWPNVTPRMRSNLPFSCMVGLTIVGLIQADGKARSLHRLPHQRAARFDLATGDTLLGALILTPSRSSRVRNSRANSTAPGVSLCTQMVSPRTATSPPSTERTLP